MHRNSTAEQVRLAVENEFRQLGAKLNQPMREKILIRDGTYCGHRFACDEFQAVWFIEENEIKIYGNQGRVVRVLTPMRFEPLKAA